MGAARGAAARSRHCRPDAASASGLGPPASLPGQDGLPDATGVVAGCAAAQGSWADQRYRVQLSQPVQARAAIASRERTNLSGQFTLGVSGPFLCLASALGLGPGHEPEGVLDGLGIAPMLARQDIDADGRVEPAA